MRSKYIKLLFLALPLFCVVLLAWLSHQDGGKTVKQSYLILDMLKRINIYIEYQRFRDMMHLLAFFFIGTTIYISINRTNPPMFISIIITLVLLPLIALTDEYHQSFISGRTSSFEDFQLDMFGGISGLIVGILLCDITHKLIIKSVNKKNSVQ